MRNKLFSRLESLSSDVVTWQRELTSRPALGPDSGGDGEEEKAAWLREELARLNLENITRHDCPDPRVSAGFRPNISALLPGKSAKTLWVVGHMDIVPPGEESLWEASPYELRVDGDFIIGRGVEDNQQAIVTAMLVAKALKQEGVTPDLSLGLLFVADEETGMTYGLPHVLKAAPDLLKKDDLILVSDIGDHDGSLVEVAEKSLLWFRFEITGKQSHASTPDKGINSLVVASACVLELERLYRTFREKDPLFSPSWSTFVPSKKEANVKNINTMPGKDVFYLDCRVLPIYNLDDVVKEVEAIAAEVAGRYKAQVDVSIVSREQAPAPTSTEAPIVTRLCTSLKRVRGIDAKISGVGGQTVSAPLRHLGFCTAAWGTLMPNAHAPNERSRISATIADAKVVADMLFD